MFQYAAGRALSLKHKAQLLLDTADFSACKRLQGFELSQVFNCDAKIASTRDVRQMLGWRASYTARRFLRRSSLALLQGPRFIAEPHFHFWSDFFQLPADRYLMGYWQSEKYFRSIADVIRSDFKFKRELFGKNKDLESRLTAHNSVSVHIRRGDFVTDVKTRAVLNLLPVEYYDAAINRIAEMAEKPQFFIFSDDIPWVKDHLKTSFPCHFIDHNHGAESYNDMHLMSLCRHHIIANSSFSWWGAWLDPRPDKLVIAPEKWFVNENSVRDLIPDGWVAL